MAIGLAHYTAVDAVLVLRNHGDRSERLIATLGAFGVDTREVRAIAEDSGDDEGAAARLKDLFAAAAARPGAALRAIRREPGIGLARMLTREVRERLAAIRMPPEYGILLSVAMGQAVNIVDGGVCATFRVFRPLDGSPDHGLETLELRICLPGDILWSVDAGRPETVRVPSGIPETVINALVGRGVDALFRHPVIGRKPPVIDAVGDSGPWHTVTLRSAA